MTKAKRNEHKKNMDIITENLGGIKEDIWQDPYKLANYLYMIAEAVSEILIDEERHGQTILQNSRVYSRESKILE